MQLTDSKFENERGQMFLGNQFPTESGDFKITSMGFPSGQLSSDSKDTRASPLCS